MLQPLDAAVDLALAREGARVAAGASEEQEAQSFRRRVAALLATPGIFVVIALASWSQWNLAVAVASLGVVFGGLWLYSERG